MKVGINIPEPGTFQPSYRFMKMFKEGIDNSGVNEVATKDEIVRSHNAFVPEVYQVLVQGLHENDEDTTRLYIETKDVFRDNEVDTFLRDHEVHLADRTYHDANQKFIYFDTVSGKLKQI